MSEPKGAPGCRDTAIVTGFLLSFAIVLFAIGLTLVNGDGCTALCEDAGLTLLYAGGPISAIFGVLTDALVIAWPLDITLWVVLGFAAARWAGSRDGSAMGYGTLILGIALAYGLVLSRFVELTT